MSGILRARGQLVVTFTLLLGTAQVAPSSAQTLFTESFAGGLNSMTPVAVCGTGANWFHETACADSAGASSPPGHAAAHDPGGSCSDYADGDASTALESPSIDVSSCSRALVLDFDYLIDFEEDFEFDRARVELDLDGGGFVQIATNPGDPGGPTCAGAPAPIGNLIADRAWHSASLFLADLSASPATAATVRFLLEVGDNIDNTGQGFFVDDVEVACVGSADLRLTKSDSADAVAAGQNLTYTLTVTNAGPDGSTGATVTDVLPASVSFVSSASGCAEAGGTVTCPVGALAAGASEVHSFTVRVDPAVSGILATTATVSGNEIDPAAANEAFEATQVLGFAAVRPFGSLIYEADFTLAYDLDDSLAAGGPAFDFEDISGSGSALVLDDDEVSAAQALGFAFEFFGADYSEVYVSSNGFLSFLPGPDDGCCDGLLLPTRGADNDDPNAIVAAWWTDLDPEAGGTIHTQTLGSAPGRRFIVQFTDIQHIGGGDPVTFQVKLFESGGDIEVHYLEAPTDGSDHTAGIEDETGTAGETYFFGTGPLPTPLAVRYRPSVDAAVAFGFDAGQTVTVVADPSAGLQSSVQLEDPGSSVIGSATSAAAGLEAVVQTVTAATAGTYTVRTAADRAGGASPGALGVRVMLNAAAEEEAHDGAGNDVRATAQDIASSFIEVGAGVLRGAVVGDGTDDTATVIDADDFESGSLDGQWTTSSSEPEGRIQVTGAFGTAGGAFALLMDRTPRGPNTVNEAIWTVDLSGVTDALLRFAHADFDDEPDPFAGGSFVGSEDADGIAISDDGVTWHPIFVPPEQPDGVWVDYTLDLAAEAAAAGLTLGPGFQVKFQQYNDADLPIDGRGWDQIAIVQPSVDFYRFELDEGEIVSLAAATGDGIGAGLELQDGGGTPLATGVSGATNASSSISDFVVPATATYFARVETGTTGYALVVSRGAAFGLEPNDDLASAQDIGATGKVLGGLERRGLFVYEVSGSEILELDPRTGAVVHRFPSPITPPIGPPFVGLATTPTTLLAGGFGPFPIFELDATTGATLRTLPHPAVGLTGLAFLGGEIFLLDDFPGPSRLIVLDYATGAVVRTVSVPPVVLGLGASATALLGTSFDEVYEIDPVTGSTSLLGTIPGIEFDSLGLGVLDDELFIADVFDVEVFDLGTLTPLRTFSGFDPLFAVGADSEGISEDDVYSLTVSAGTTLMLQTLTPGDDPLEFANHLDPAIELYDPTDVLVAADDNSAADGRNAELTHVALATGSYKVRVLRAGSSGGEYLLQAAADLGLAKGDFPDPVVAGTNLTFTLDLTNGGPGGATAVTVTDPVPAGTTFVSAAVTAGSGWTISAPPVGGTGDVVFSKALVAGGENASFELVVQVGAGVPAGTLLTKSATVATASPDLDPGNDTAGTTTTVRVEADLAVTKVDLSDPAVAGTDLVYVVGVTSAGPSDATGVTVTDTLPAGVTPTATSGCAEDPAGVPVCTLGTIPAGGSASYTLTVAVNSATTGAITNLARVDSAADDPVPGNDSTSEDTTVIAESDIAVTKTDGMTGASPGDLVTYTITVTKAGPSDAPDTTVEDVFPAQLSGVTWTCTASPGSTCTPAGGGDITDVVYLEAGGTVSYLAAGTIDPTFVGTLENSATATPSPDVTDTDPSNNTGTDTTVVTSPAEVSGTMVVAEILGERGASGFAVGDEVIYTVTLMNSSPTAQLDNPGDEFVDQLPPELTLLAASADSGVATIDPATNTAAWNGMIASGGTVVIEVEARIAYGADGATISNQGTISYDADGDGVNEATALTDDPAVAGGEDPTTFVVLAAIEIPTLGPVGLWLLVLILAAGGLSALRSVRHPRRDEL